MCTRQYHDGEGYVYSETARSEMTPGIYKENHLPIMTTAGDDDIGKFTQRLPPIPRICVRVKSVHEIIAAVALNDRFLRIYGMSERASERARDAVEDIYFFRERKLRRFPRWMSASEREARDLASAVAISGAGRAREVMCH